MDFACKRCEDTGGVFQARLARLLSSKDAAIELPQMGFDLGTEIESHPDLDPAYTRYRQRGETQPCPDCGGRNFRGPLPAVKRTTEA